MLRLHIVSPSCPPSLSARAKTDVTSIAAFDACAKTKARAVKARRAETRTLESSKEKAWKRERNL